MSVTVVVPVTAGIKLPENGTDKNDLRFTISTLANDGPVLPVSILSSPSVAVLRRSAVTFSMPLAGAVTAVDMSFTFEQAMLPDDLIRIKLPGFSRQCPAKPPSCPVEEYVNLTGTSAPFLRGVWLNANETLLLTVLDEIPPSVPLAFTLPSSLGVRVPIAGVGVFRPSLSIAIEGPLSASSDRELSNVQPVGALRTDTASLGIAPAKANEPVNLTVIFVPEMPLGEGETVSIRLANFTGPRTFTVILRRLISGPSASTFNAEWDNATSSLVLRVMSGTQVLSGSLVEITVQAGSGIRSPVNGLKSTDILLISAQAASGPMLGTPIAHGTIGSVGGILSINFAPPVAGALTRITMRFALQMPLLAGEQCMVNLPGFTRDEPRGAPLVNDEAEGGTRNVRLTWSPATPSVIMVPTAVVQGLVTISLPLTSGIRMPVNGISAASPPITLECSASNGDISATSFLDVQYVGRFQEGSTSLSFQPALADEPAAIVMSFALSVDTKRGEAMFLVLPGFMRTLMTSEPIMLMGIGTVFFPSGLWDSETFTLTMLASRDVPAGTLITLTVPISAGIRLAKEGVPAAGSGIGLAFNGTGGPVIPAPFTSLQVVGAFGGTSLMFDPPVAAAPARLWLRFVTSMRIFAGEQLRIDLLGFVALSDRPLLYGNNASLFTATWIARQDFPDELRTTIGLTVNRTVVKGTAVEVALGMLKLPTDGIGPLYKGLTIAASASEGPVNATQFSSWQRIGSFSNTPRISFLPLGDTPQVPVTLQFAPKMDIRSGEKVFVRLARFSGRDAATISNLVSEPPGKFSSASWVEMEELLTLVVAPGQTIGINEYVKVVVPRTAGITLPNDGVQNSVNLTIATNAADGPVLPVEFGDSAIGQVGSMSDTSISFIPLLVGRPVAITVTFRVSTPVAKDDILKIVLPDFRRPTTIGSFVTQNNDWRDGDWVDDGQCKSLRSDGFCEAYDPMLILYAAKQIQAGSYFAVIISAEVGIWLPWQGVRPDSKSILIRVEAKGAPSLAQAFQRISAVGTFLKEREPGVASTTFINSTKISFERIGGGRAIAGQPCKMTLQFQAAMSIGAGQTVRWKLPRFSGIFTDYEPKNVALEWNSRDMVLIMTVVGANNAIAANTPFTLSVSGLVLPNVGVLLNALDITIQTDASAGPVVAESVSDTQPVGALYASQLQYGRPIAGEVTSLIIALTMSAPMYAGELIVLYLPNFDRTAVNRMPQCKGTLNCSWTGRSAQGQQINELTLVIESNVAAGARYEAEVPFDAGIRLPVDGTLINDQRLQVRTEASQGPVPFTPFLLSPCVGTFYQTGVCFAPTRAGLPTGVTTTFQYNRNFAYGDTVRIKLHGFTRTRELAGVPMKLNDYKFTDASWNNAAQILTLTATFFIPPMTLVTVYVPETEGLIVPVDGIEMSDSRFTIATDTPEGIVQPTALRTVPAIGSFGQQAHLSFCDDKGVCGLSRGRAARPVGLNISFVNKMTLRENDVVSIVLPGFRNGTRGETGGCACMCDVLRLAVHVCVRLGARVCVMYGDWLYMCICMMYFR